LESSLHIPVQAFAAVLLTLLRLQDQGLPSLANPLGGMRLAPAAEGPGMHHPHPRHGGQRPGLLSSYISSR
jgi:hypothetical protein